MGRAKLISLSRIWYTIFVVLIHLILFFFGIKRCYYNDQFLWSNSSSKIELLIEKICLLTSFVLLFIFIYPALFRIGNLSNDNQSLTIEDFDPHHRKKSLCTSLWHHCFSLSSTLHLTMSFLIIISTVLIDAKQITLGLKDSVLLWRTDFDLLFDWSSTISPAFKRFPTSSNMTTASLSFSVDSYSRLCLLNFLFASFVCVLREPRVFWSISKMFSIIYSFALALNVIQWCFMYGAFQLVLKNICFNTIESTQDLGYLLLRQPYTTFFLYVLLEFLIYISSITFYYYAYNRFKYHKNFHGKSSCYDRCSNYCPSVIGIIILLLYTSCKLPLVHDIFLLYVQTRLSILLMTFTFEIVHVLLILALWIYLTTKSDWHLKKEECSSHGLTVKNTSIQPTAVSMPELNGNGSLMDTTARRLSDNIYQKPYEKIRIFQSEIYYRNRPKNWSLPLNQQPTMMATFDHDDDENDIIVRSTSHPTNKTNNEIEYREAIRKTVSNLYKVPRMNEEENLPNAILLRKNTPPTPPAKCFTQEQVEAARMRAQQIRSSDFMPHHRSATLLISQV